MILVDGITTHETKLRHKQWSHMVSTVGLDELHAFASRLRLLRRWFQPVSFAHYDITPGKRARALELGAREVTSRALLFLNFDYANKRQVRPCDRCQAAGALPREWVPGCMRCDLSLYMPADR